MKFEDAVRQSLNAQMEALNSLSQLVTVQSKRIDALTASAEASTGVTNALGNMIESLQALVNALRTAHDLQISSICERLQSIEGNPRPSAEPQ